MDRVGRVVVVGAGVIGLWCAYELRRRGLDVVLLDKGEPGDACSRANTGWIVPSFSSPLPAPGLTWTSLKWMASADSPLYIRPSAAPSLAGWLWTFWRHCNARDFRAGLEAVALLNERTMELFENLEDDGVRCELHKSGLLCAFGSEKGLERMLASLQTIAGHGLVDPQRLSAREARDLEPALSEEISGGILMESERHVLPESLNQGLLDRVTDLGVEVRSHTEVCCEVREGSLVRSVIAGAAARTGAAESSGEEAADSTGGAGSTAGDGPSRTPIEGDAFVLAAGAWSGQLAERFGIALPMQAGKGYSITLENPAVRLRRPVYFPEKKVVTSPFDGALRVGGTMELSGINEDLDPRRTAAIGRVAEHFLPGSLEGEQAQEWVGMRPLTPDGLPVIGRAPGYDNLYLATGHAMLGITLAPVTAVAVTDLIVSGRTDIPVGPFDPGRFC